MWLGCWPCRKTWPGVSDDRGRRRPHITDLEEKVAAVRTQVAEAALVLRRKRVAGAGPLAVRAQEMVAPLALQEIDVALTVEPNLDPEGLVEVDGRRCAVTAHGADRVELLVRTNRGEPYGPVGKIASGGEKSRIFLGLSVLAEQEQTAALQLYDEIDAGLGMDNAVPVARLLGQLSRQIQVLCITHLPTVAAHGRRHLKVAKEVNGDRTRVTVREIHDEERVQEIRRLLGGELPGESAGESQDDYARQLLAAHGAQAGGLA